MHFVVLTSLMITFRGHYCHTLWLNTLFKYIMVDLFVVLCLFSCHVSSIWVYNVSYNIILSYAFKIRQDYLSTSYLDPIKYSPSQWSEQGRYELIQVTCAEIILFILKAYDYIFSHTFHYFTDEISPKYYNVLKSCKTHFITDMPHWWFDTWQIIDRRAEFSKYADVITRVTRAKMFYLNSEVPFAF